MIELTLSIEDKCKQAYKADGLAGYVTALSTALTQLGYPVEVRQGLIPTNIKVLVNGWEVSIYDDKDSHVELIRFWVHYRGDVTATGLDRVDILLGSCKYLSLVLAAVLGEVTFK